MTIGLISRRRADILEQIASAADRVGRDPAEIEIVAITKTVPVERIREAIAAGFRLFGENRVQERQAKAVELDAAPTDVAPTGAAGETPRWHLVGPLQSNKARRAIELFDVIETVDSVDLAERLGRLVAEVRAGSSLPVLLEVNVDADPAKSGFAPADLQRDLGRLLDVTNLRVDGLMTVGRLVEVAEDARPTFRALRELSERLRARDGRLGPALSMGMSNDYPVAVEEGATLVRLGRVLFGERPPAG